MFSDWWDVKEFWKSSRKIGGSPELNARHQRGPKGCAVGLRTLARPHKMWLQKDRHKGAKQAEYLARSKRYQVFKPWGALRIRETCSVITAEHARFDASCTCQSWCQDTLDKNGGGCCWRHVDSITGYKRAVQRDFSQPNKGTVGNGSTLKAGKSYLKRC